MEFKSDITVEMVQSMGVSPPKRRPKGRKR